MSLEDGWKIKGHEEPAAQLAPAEAEAPSPDTVVASARELAALMVPFYERTCEVDFTKFEVVIEPSCQLRVLAREVQALKNDVQTLAQLERDRIRKASTPSRWRRLRNWALAWFTRKALNS